MERKERRTEAEKQTYRGMPTGKRDRQKGREVKRQTDRLKDRANYIQRVRQRKRQIYQG